MRWLFSAANFWLWFGLVWLLVGVPFVFVGVQGALQAHLIAQRLDRDALVASATVVSKQIDIGRHRAGDSPLVLPDYYVQIRFQTESGTTVEGEAKVAHGTWKKLEEGGLVDVRYLPDAPQYYRLPDQKEPWGLNAALIGLGALFTTIGALVAARGVTHLRIALRLRAHGTPADATVVKIAPSNVTINGIRQMIVRYRYQDGSGRARTGKSDPMSPDDANEWSEGARGRIRFDPKLPQRSVWIGREDA